MNVTKTTIPHSAQRYSTSGDWQIDEKGNISITVSDLHDWKREWLVGQHEEIETVLCTIAGITQAMVDAYDMAWKEHDGIEEPGDDPDCPYYQQHQIALAYEHSLAVDVGVNFKQHDRALLEGDEPK